MKTLITVRKISKPYEAYSIRYIETVLKANKTTLSGDLTMYMVSNNHVDIGLCLYDPISKQIQVMQAPGVCRMSILSLIDASIVIAQQYEEAITFVGINYAHIFKFSQIFPTLKVEDSQLFVSKDVLQIVDMTEISLKKIVFEI